MVRALVAWVSCLNLIFVAITRYPARQITLYKICQRLNVRVTVVERRYIAESAAACADKDLAILLIDLLEGLEAIGGEAGADNLDVRHTLPAEPLQGLVGIGWSQGSRPKRD